MSGTDIVQQGPDIRGVKVLATDPAGRILLVKIAYSHKRWTLPGGGVEPNESFEEAALREFQEETGVAMSSLHFFGQYEGTNPKPHPVRCFSTTIEQATMSPQPEEISDIAWFEIENLPHDRADKLDMIIGMYRNARI